MYNGVLCLIKYKYFRIDILSLNLVTQKNFTLKKWWILNFVETLS